jgi:cobalt/nickel transport system permease protein
MHETLEEAQINSRKVVDGHLKVYLALSSLIIVQILGWGTQILAIVFFTVLGLYGDRKTYLRILKVPLFFLIAGTIVILFTIEGESLLRFWILEISDRSLEVAANTLLRSVSSLTIMAFMILTTTVPEFVSTLSMLRMPSFILELMFLAYRAIQILFEELYKLDTAASIRMGYINAARMVRTASLLAFSVFIRSMRRAEIMEEAMRARCYSGFHPEPFVENRGFVVAIVVLASLCLAGWAI